MPATLYRADIVRRRELQGIFAQTESDRTAGVGQDRLHAGRTTSGKKQPSKLMRYSISSRKSAFDQSGSYKPK